MSIAQTLAKAVARATSGGKPSGSSGKFLGAGKPGGLIPGIPGDIGDMLNFGASVLGNLPSLGGGGGPFGVPATILDAPPPGMFGGGGLQLPPGSLSFTGAGPATGASKKAKVAAANAMVGCPAGYHPAKDGSGRCVRNRRMNVCNMRAASRAARRLKGARKALQRIERAMPRRTTRSSPRRGIRHITGPQHG